MQKESERAWAYYREFSVGNASSKYTLGVTGYMTESKAGNSLEYHNGGRFSAPD